MISTAVIAFLPISSRVSVISSEVRYVYQFVHMRLLYYVYSLSLPPSAVANTPDLSFPHKIPLIHTVLLIPGHTYERTDREGTFHCLWDDTHKDIGDLAGRTAGEM